MKEDKNMFNILFSSDIINMACKDIADNKTSREINELLIEEISELIKPVITNSVFKELGKTALASCGFHPLLISKV